MSASDLLAGLGVALWGTRFAWLLLAPFGRRIPPAPIPVAGHRQRAIAEPGRQRTPVVAPRRDPIAPRELALAAHRHFGADLTAYGPDRDSEVPGADIIVVSRRRALDRALAGHARPVLCVRHDPGA